MLSRHPLAVATFISIALLITAANLESPRWWLLVPGWLILATCIIVRFEKIPNESPYKQALYVTTFALIFCFGLFRPLLYLILEPSGSHLSAFLTNRSFLVFIILYLAVVCNFYSTNLQKLRDRLKGLEDRQKNSCTMTMTEAEEILDITSRALQDQSDLHYHRVSLLKGYDVFQTDKALKLRIANEF